MLERLFKAPLTETMKRKYGRCETAEDVITTIVDDYFSLALRVDVFTEMAACLPIDGMRWSPRDGWDGVGALVMGDNAAAARVQVRSCSNREINAWQFKTRDSLKEKRYDILICAGYPLPFSYRSENQLSMDHINPLRAKWFVIPISAVNEATITISREGFHQRSSGRPNQWYEYNVEYSELESAVTKLAHGRPLRHEPQISLFDGIAQ